MRHDVSDAVWVSGILPANILPFRADLSIDEPAYRRHLRWLADTPGVTGIEFERDLRYPVCSHRASFSWCEQASNHRFYRTLEGLDGCLVSSFTTPRCRRTPGPRPGDARRYAT